MNIRFRLPSARAGLQLEARHLASPQPAYVNTREAPNFKKKKKFDPPPSL
jgi:hypothetical protein